MTSPDSATGAARILVVDDEESLRQMMQVMLQRAGHEVVLASDVRSAREVVEGAPPFDLVISDLVMPDGTGLDVLDFVRRRSQETQVIIVTAHASVETAVEAMQRGAYGYLEKPVAMANTRAMIAKALEKRLLLRDNASLRALARAASPNGVNIIGRSPAYAAAMDLVRRAARSRTSVLITGESGTGKEMFARVLHAESDRRDKPFVVVNCGAIPEALLESELFGHEKGAFTGAVSRRDGLFREADGATLLLDEVGELPAAMQVKLLRALQERKIRPVGSNQEVSVDVRIVAATNRDLEADVKAGRFRQDLYYRLNVLRIEVPPLRTRRDDVALLIEHFRARYGGEQGRPLVAFSPEAMRALLAYDFPGNVRELENAVERAVTLAHANTIELVDLPREITGGPATVSLASVLPEEGIDLEAFLANVERSLLTQALERANGVRTKAAAMLGLSFRSIRYRLAKLGVDGEPAPDDDDVAAPGAPNKGRTSRPG